MVGEGCALKWGWRVLALGLLIAAALAAPWAARTAVVDVKQRLKPEKPAWQGVVAVGVVPSFSTVNVNGWLKASFRRFEAQNSGVLVSLRELTETGVRTGAAAGTLPDALLFGMTVPLDAEQLLQPLQDNQSVCSDLQNAGVWGGKRLALPVAMGGYALLGNRKLLDAAGWSPSLNFDDTMALLAEKDMAVATPQMPYTDPLRAEYPFQLIGHHGKTRTHSSYGNVPWMNSVAPQQCWINDLDAANLGIAQDDEVIVSTERGRSKLTAKVTNRIMPGVVSIPQGGWYEPETRDPESIGSPDTLDLGGCISVLTSVRPTPISKGNGVHSNLCKIEKA